MTVPLAHPRTKTACVGSRTNGPGDSIEKVSSAEIPVAVLVEIAEGQPTRKDGHGY